jgi:hypothetical protein
MEILQIFWTYQIFLFANLKQKWQIVDFGYADPIFIVQGHFSLYK